MMSDLRQTLRSRIREDYLTCPICMNEFTKPKALPCLHTFCLECLRDYVATKHKDEGKFPCPSCRADVAIPPQGLEGFTDNYMVSSLLDTVDDNSLPSIVPQPPGGASKPVPAPRSISPRDPNRLQEDGRPVPAPRSLSPLPSSGIRPPAVPPRPKSVSPTPGFTGEQSSNLTSGPEAAQNNMPQPPAVSYSQQFSHLVTGGIGGVVGAVGSALSDISGYLHPPKLPQPPMESPTSPFEFVPRTSGTENPSESVNSGLYPLISAEDKGPCTDRMLLQFGKFGPAVNDFMKPFGLAVGCSGEFVISDRGGNRVFVFSNKGELKLRFNLNCTVNGVAVTKDSRILTAVAKSGSNIMRMYSMEGHFLQGFGEYYKFDLSSGITVTPSNHVAISNLAADNVLIFTEQRKFSTKFGWKGRGQNHFMKPTFVTSTSKDYIVVSDTGNNCIKLFDISGNFKRSFGSLGNSHGQLNSPLGVATDAEDNIIVADAGNFRVEIFTVKGVFYTTLIQGTNMIGPDVKPVNVAVTKCNNIAVLLCGTGFSEVRVCSWRYQHGGQSNI